MFARTLQRFFVASTKLQSCKSLKNTSLFVPELVLLRQNTVVGLHVSAKCQKEEEKIIIPTDSIERAEYLQQSAQKDIDAMIKDNPELQKSMQVYEMEMVMWKQQGQLVPEKVKPTHWLELLKLKSKNQRRRYLEFLFKIEKKDENRKERQREKNEEWRKKKLEDDGDGPGATLDVMKYNIGKNTMFRRITETSINHLYQWNSLKAIMYGNKIIFDCSYEKYMNSKEIKSCARQIMEAYSYNRQHNFPFDIYLCNADSSSYFIKTLIKLIPNLYADDFPWTVTSKSFMEVFDNSKLVYLSGHSNSILDKYDSDSVYIIGAFVDKSYHYPVSLAKAKELNIRTAKFPLDNYVHFGDGSNKNLTLNQVMAIMLDAQGGDWNKAFEHVPKRKLFESRLAAMERRMQKSMFKDRNSSQSENALSSGPVSDFSYAARIKMQNSWSKE